MKKRILVIDDSRLAREMLKSTLSKHDYIVESVNEGKEGIRKISTKKYDLAIIDYILPDVDGLEILRRINKKKYNIPVVILTGGGSEEVAVKAMKLGALDYVVKEEGYCHVIERIIKEDLRLYQQFEEKRQMEEEKIAVPSKSKRKDRDRILVVDDSLLVREMLCDTLKRNDYDVDAAEGGREALKMISSKDYDLAVVDYMMPDMTGLEVLEKIKAQYPVPVIIFTGKGSEEVAVRAMKLGALDYVVKGIGDMQVLPSIIKENLYVYRAKLPSSPDEGALSDVQQNRENILVVDDSFQTREMTRKALVSLGYNVDAACSGLEALEKIIAGHYDLAIVDYMMPGMNGLEVLKKVTEKGHDVPVIVFTGRGSEEVAVEAMKLGALDYVIKTVGYLERLSKIVQRNLNIHRMKEEKKNLENELMKKNRDLEERIKQLRALNEISKRIGEKLDLSRTLSVIVTKISELLHCTRITIMLLDGKKKYLSIRASKGFPEDEASKVKVKIGKDISGYVVEQKEALFTLNIEADSRFKKINEEQYFNKSLISVPLLFDDDVIGVINVNNKSDRSDFTIDDKNILVTIAYHAAIAIENSRRFEQAQKAAVTDSLTGLYNQRYFFKCLDMEVERARRYKTELSLIIIDLDGFKQVNDNYGHQQGDVILTKIASLLSLSVRKPTTLARYGGEEFAIIVPQTSIEGAAMMAERLRKKIEKHYFLTGDNGKLKLTISLGVGDYKKGMSPKGLVECSDKALYLAKKKGKNTFCLCSDVKKGSASLSRGACKKKRSVRQRKKQS